MQNLISFLSDFWNGWSLIPTFIIFVLSILLARKTSHCNQSNNELLFQKALNTEMKLEHLSQLKVKNNQIGQMQSDLLTSKQNEVKLQSGKLYWRERALHIKHTQKTDIESEKYICNTDIYLPHFGNGKEYKVSKSKVNYDKETTLCLISEDGRSSLVEKNNFLPVKYRAANTRQLRIDTGFNSKTNKIINYEIH